MGRLCLRFITAKSFHRADRNPADDPCEFPVTGIPLRRVSVGEHLGEVGVIFLHARSLILGVKGVCGLLRGGFFSTGRGGAFASVRARILAGFWGAHSAKGDDNGMCFAEQKLAWEGGVFVRGSLSIRTTARLPSVPGGV